MTVAKQLLDLADVDAGIRKQGSGGGARRMGAEDVRAVFDRAGQPGQIIGDHNEALC